jgi:hypothetical protein
VTHKPCVQRPESTMSNNSPLSPQQRLALSRQTIVRHMTDGSLPEDSSDSVPYSDAGQHHNGVGTWDLLKQAGALWWHGHPAHTALDIAKPLVRNYAEKEPYKLLGISVAVGAAVVVLRPWRLVSLTGLLLATLKSPELSGVMRSVRTSDPRADRPL